MAINEEVLINRCQGGNLKYFSELYDLYIKKIYEFIYFKTHHKQIAEDLTSQTFLKSLENIQKYNSEKGRFSSWLYAIARNSVIDYYRTKKHNLNIDDAWDISSKDNIILDAENKEKIEKLKTHLKKLTGDQRDVIILRVWNDMSYKEISEIMGKSEANCKMIFSRATEKIRKEQIFAILLCLLLI
jgi:RNA polymerase sigma-70 factor (ECF subfamily)